MSKTNDHYFDNPPELKSSEPIIVYHGTGFELKDFKCPAYFADNDDTAKFFAKQHKEKSLILTCSLVLKNPLIVNLDGQSWGGFHLQDTRLQNSCIKYISENDADEEEYFKDEGLTIGFLADYAESLGYDGLIAYNCYEEDDSIGTQYVAFVPDNIRVETVVEL